MIYSKVGVHLTEQFEQCRTVAYMDEGGRWTIGWGHTKRVYQGQTCTALQALQWLLDDIKDAETFVNQVVRAPLNQEEFDALVDFVYNVGAMKFEGSTMLKLLNLRNYEGAANEFIRWHFVHGQESAGLLRRRKAEAAQFEDGIRHQETEGNAGAD